MIHMKGEVASKSKPMNEVSIMYIYGLLKAAPSVGTGAACIGGSAQVFIAGNHSRDFHWPIIAMMHHQGFPQKEKINDACESKTALRSSTKRYLF